MPVNALHPRVPPLPSAQSPRLSAQSSKDDFLKAIRDASTQIGRKPLPFELRRQLGPVFDLLSDKYYPTPITAIQSAYAQRPVSAPVPTPSAPPRAPDAAFQPRIVPPIFEPETLPRPAAKTWDQLKHVMGYPAWRYGYLKDLWRSRHGTVAMPPEVVLIGHKRGSQNDSPVSAIALLTIEELNARTIPQPYFQVVLSDGMRHVKSVQGVGALELGVAAEFGRDLPPVEMAVVARVWGTQYQAGKKKITWAQFLKHVFTSGQNFVSNLWRAQSIAKFGREINIPNDLVLLVRREGRSDAALAAGIRLLTLEQFEASRDDLSDDSLAKVFLSMNPTTRHHVISDVWDAGAFDVAAEMVGGQLGGLDAYERNLLSNILESRSRTDTRPEKVEDVSWNGINSRVADGIDKLFKRYWRIRRVVDPELPESPSQLTLIVRRYVENKKNNVGGIRLLMPNELQDADLGNDVVRLEGTLTANGVYKPTGYAGWDGKELHDTAQGVVTYAPDADALVEEARRFAAQPAIYVGDDLVCKPEPLTTPADVMTMPQLEYPADVVEQPKLGGFEVMDPEKMRQLAAIPPSDHIPVITGPREEDVEKMGIAAGIAAMIMGVIACASGACVIRTPAFGSGGLFLTPRERLEKNGT